MDPGPDTLPLWLRPSRWALWTRAGTLALGFAAYTAGFLFAPPDAAFAMRPLNMIFVVVCGVFFGTRGGAAVALAVVAVNLFMYGQVGILGASTSTLTSNLMSGFFGVLTAAFVGHVRDLSLRLRSEVRLRRQAEARRDELTALLVHDLKNPLAGISGHAQLLSEDGGGEYLAESLQYIRSAAERMTRMVMNLLDIGKAEDGALRPSLQAVDLPALLGEVHASVMPQLQERRQDLRLLLTGDGGRLTADPDLLRRMLLNLLENAIKYTPKETEIRLEVREVEGGVEVCVRDQGPGIPPGFEDRVFDKYARLEAGAGAASEVSRGLGLHFCKLAAAAHGGRIWVERNEPRGSAFRFRLPKGPSARA